MTAGRYEADANNSNRADQPHFGEQNHLPNFDVMTLHSDYRNLHRHSTCSNLPEIKFEDSELSHAGISKTITEKGEETRYPNGVVVTRTPDGGMGMEGPPGSRLIVDENQTSVIYDARGKRIAVMDRNDNVYVTDKGKTFYEGKDGDVFPATNDCQLEQTLRSVSKPIYDSH